MKELKQEIEKIISHPYLARDMCNTWNGGKCTCATAKKVADIADLIRKREVEAVKEYLAEKEKNRYICSECGIQSPTEKESSGFHLLSCSDYYLNKRAKERTDVK